MKGLETLLITTCEKIKRDESYLARVASDIAEIGQSECKLFTMHIISGGMVLQVNYGWICMDWLPILATKQSRITCYMNLDDLRWYRSQNICQLWCVISKLLSS